jgi:hypothetical protein
MRFGGSVTGPQTVGEGMRIEHGHLLSSAGEGFSLAEESFPTVDGKGCVRVRTNFYSVPVKPHTVVHAKVLPAYVEVWHDGQCVARHERCYRIQQQILDLETLSGRFGAKAWRTGR